MAMRPVEHAMSAAALSPDVSRARADGVTSSTRTRPVTANAPIAPWQQLCSQLLAHMLEAACIVDSSSQHVLAANPAACTLFGATAAELLGRPVTELCTAPEDLCFWADVDLSGPAGTGLHSDTLIHALTGPHSPTGHIEVIEVERRLAPLTLPDGRHAWLLTWRDQTERRRVDDELDRLSDELHEALDCRDDAVVVTDLDGAMRHCNRAYAELWALPLEAPRSRDDARLAAALRAQMADPGVYDARLAQLAADPRLAATDVVTLVDGRVFERRVMPQFGRGAPVGRLWAWRDISQRLADEARLRLAGQVFDASIDAILVTDRERRVVAANPAATLLLKRTSSALQGQALASLIHDPQAAGAIAMVFATVEREGHWQGDLATRPNAGDLEPGVPVQVSMQWRGGTDIGGGIVILRDQSERRAQQDALRELLQLDLLTGLPNRHRLAARVAQHVEACQAKSPDQLADQSADHKADQLPDQTSDQPGFALLLVGLDRFAALNDALSNNGGDRVLIEVGMRLAAGVGPNDMVCRTGSDNFAVLLAQADAAAAQASARRLLDSLGAAMCVDGLHFNLSASIGIACGPHDGTSLDDLLKNADSAMQRVKQRSGGDLCFYQPTMTTDLLPRIRLDHAMRHALRAGQFRLHYQPQVDMNGAQVIGAEALLRWRDPVLGDIPPGQFIPVAEETGFIAELGMWVMAQAINQASEWHDQGLMIPVSVNVSTLQFQQAGFVDHVAALLDASGLAPAMLELELTESVLLGDIAEIIDQLERLAGLGVRLAIDDFGTGYSGLGYLKRLPIHRLKIDRCFVKDLPGDASDAAITRGVIAMARALDLQVIAEGVETEAQRAFLAEIGCHEYQGWLFAPALPPDQFALRAGLAAPRAVKAHRSTMTPVLGIAA
jgi:diguanylate cyclase (GGDEF)-like protein